MRVHGDDFAGRPSIDAPQRESPSELAPLADRVHVLATAPNSVSSAYHKLRAAVHRPLIDTSRPSRERCSLRLSGKLHRVLPQSTELRIDRSEAQQLRIDTPSPR